MDIMTDARTWDTVLSFRIDGLGNIALYDEMGEETLIVERATLGTEYEIHEQMQKMLRVAAEFHVS